MNAQSALSASLVGDLRAGTTGSEPQELTNVEGVLYFSADNGTHGRELWKSDPRTGETRMIVDLNAGMADSSPTGLVNFQGRLYFAATTASFGRQLWMYDPATEKTDRVVDTALRTGATAPESLTPVGPFLFFTADDGVRGRELWFLRGKTKVRLDIVRDITPGPTDPHGSSPPHSLTAVGDTLFFAANDGSTGYELWKVDTVGVAFSANPAATRVRDIRPGAESSLLSDFVSFNDRLFFTVFDSAVAPGRRLWQSDGTGPGTTLFNPTLIVHNPEVGSTRTLVPVDNKLFFPGTVTTVDDAELFVTDGISTSLVRDIYPGTRSSIPSQLTKVFGVLFFAARDGIFEAPPPEGEGAKGFELWRSDGTTGGTRMVKDIFPGSNAPGFRDRNPLNSVPTELMEALGTAFFAAYDVDSASTNDIGKNLWMSDGTEAGTMRVLVLPNKANPTRMTLVDTTVFFTAEDAGRGRELWKVVLPDADGDGLLDKWETTGIDYDMDGVIDLNLPAMGANPTHKDVFVEADWMADANHTHHPSFLPKSIPLPIGDGADELVQAQFALAPAANVKNPDGRPGIDLHFMVDAGEVIPDAPLIRFTTRDPKYPHFQDLKRRFFGFGSYGTPGSKNVVKLGAHRIVFRYAIFGHGYAEDPRSTGIAGGPDFLVTVSCHGNGPSPLPADYEDGIHNVILAKFPGTTFEKEWADGVAGTLMHELGHTLGLFHGGGRGIPAILAENRFINNKPNYLSVMNYAFQSNKWGRAFGVSGVADNSETRTERQLDYSAVALSELDEKLLLEPLGIAGPAGRRTRYGAPGGPNFFDAYIGPSFGAIDWDGNLSIEEGNVTGDINFYGAPSVANPRTPDEILVGHDDWSNLVYNFRDSFLFKGGMIDEVSEPEQTIDEIFGTTPSGAVANLAINKTTTSVTVSPGASVVYTIVVTNNGPDAASDVVVTDDLPTTTTFVAATSTDGGVVGGTGNHCTISFSSLASGAAATISIGATINGSVPPGTLIDNVATVSSATADSDSTDNAGSVSVQVAGGTNPPPVISNVSVDKPTLWPPNHQWVDVTVNYTATDDSGAPTCVLSVASNEPIDGTGDGDTAPDWEIVDPHHVRLRAERGTTGSGRIYTITIICRDSVGLTTTDQITVSVPLSQRKAK